MGDSKEDFVVINYAVDYSIPLVLADMDEPVFKEEAQ
jgi:hypothetical protein